VIKWTVKDAMRCLEDLTNPFEKKGIGNINQKPRLSEVITYMASRNNSGTQTPEILGK